MSRERPCRRRSKLLHPFAQHVLVDIEVPCRLGSADTAVTNEPNRLDLELSTELPSLPGGVRGSKFLADSPNAGDYG